MNVSDIIWPESIIQNTYTGWIYIRPEFIYFIYVLVVMILLISAFVLRKKHTIKETIKKAVIISFGCTAIVYAVAFEFIWSQWLSADISKFSGKKGDYKLVALNSDYYKFIVQCRNCIGTENYTLFPDDTKSGTDTQLKFTRLQYYLLPSRNLPDSKYLIVLYGDRMRFDEGTGVLSFGDTVFRNVTLCYSLDHKSYVFRVAK